MIVMGSPISTPPVDAFTTAVLSFSPLSYFQLRETSGSSAADLGSLGNTGTYEGSVALANLAGPDGYSYPSCTSGGMKAPDAAGYTPANSSGLTVGFLARKDNTTWASQLHLVSKWGASGSREWVVWTGPFATSEVGAWRVTSAGAAARRRESSTAPFPANAWHLVIARFDSSATAFPGLRCDGAITTTTGNTGTGAGDLGGELMVGTNGAGTAYFTGNIAHVFVIAGQISDGDCGTLETAANTVGWI